MDPFDRISAVAQAIWNASSQQCFFAIFGALLGAVLLRAGTHYVCKINLPYAKAYRCVLFASWITIGVCAFLSLLVFAGGIMAFNTLSQEYVQHLVIIANVIIVVISVFIVSFLYGEWIKNADGVPIGRRKGFLIVLTMWALMIAFIAIAVGLVWFLTGSGVFGA